MTARAAKHGQNHSSYSRQNHKYRAPDMPCTSAADLSVDLIHQPDLSPLDPLWGRYNAKRVYLPDTSRAVDT